MRKKHAGGRPVTVNATTTIVMRVDPLTVERIDALANAWNCSKAAAVRRCIEETHARSRK